MSIPKPTTTTALIEQAHAREWFYAYELPDGSRTSTYHEADIGAIHETRWRMIESCLDETLGSERAGMNTLDLASHQGWFAVNMAKSGFGRVQGINARASHVEDASLIASVYGLETLTFRQGDIQRRQLD